MASSELLLFESLCREKGVLSRRVYKGGRGRKFEKAVALSWECSGALNCLEDGTGVIVVGFVKLLEGGEERGGGRVNADVWAQVLFWSSRVTR